MDFTMFWHVRSADVWRMAQLLVAASQAGASLQVAWDPVVADDDPDVLPHAAVLWAREHAVARHGVLAHLLVAAVHERDLDVNDPELLRRIGAGAGIDSTAMMDALADLDSWRARLADAAQAARELGVDSVPALYRQGPVLHVRTNAAVNRGDPMSHLVNILNVLEDDGIWELRKP